VCEHASAHGLPDKVKAAYWCGELLDKPVADAGVGRLLPQRGAARLRVLALAMRRLIRTITA